MLHTAWKKFTSIYNHSQLSTDYKKPQWIDQTEEIFKWTNMTESVLHVHLCGSCYLLWRSWGVEPASTDQEGVRLRFAVLHLRIIAQDNVVEKTKEVFVMARLQLERYPGWAGCHRDGDIVLLQMVDEFIHTWWITLQSVGWSYTNISVCRHTRLMFSI